MAATPPASSTLYLKRFAPDVEIISESWPKLFQPDYTEVVTKILQAKPQALYSCLWGGDLASYIDQANIYALFGQMEVFAVNMADYTALTVVKNLPEGHPFRQPLHQDLSRPPPENAAWGDALQGEVQRLSDQLVVGERHRRHAAGRSRRRRRTPTDGKKIAEALRGLHHQVAVRRRRHRDHARRGPAPLVGYAIGLGHHDPAGALRAAGEAGRLEDDLRARSRVEEEQGLHLIDPCGRQAA